MPIYAFECEACGHDFERLQRLADADPTDCPVCGAARVRRQLTAPSFRLAGAGWYETDFKKDGDRKRNLADKGGDAPASTEASGPGKPDSKPEAKPETKPTGKPDAAPVPKPASVESRPAAKSVPKASG